MNWEIIIGLEVHAELSTRSKLFCPCSTAFGGAPNTQVCPVCSGMPGSLPAVNRAAVEYAMRLGLALGCSVAERCKFDRKNYFYPDLPKAYQVSQLYEPICRDGALEICSPSGPKTIGIREIHMEEDAGKLNHNGVTLMDFNRCGVPLLEIVSQPDMRGGAEAVAYLEKLRDTLLYLDICDCKMQEGSIRADVNVSVRRPGEALGTRTEMKNLNSFKAIARAIDYESRRQADILQSGGAITQETRRWDDANGVSYGMRNKENAQDYRYFPEPDLLPLRIDAAWLAAVRESLPEMAHQKRERYMREHGLSAHEAAVLTSHRNVARLYEELCALSSQPVESARLLTGEVMRLCNATGTAAEDLALDAAKLARLVGFVLDGKISRAAYKEVTEAVFTRDADVDAYIAEKGLMMSLRGDEAAEAARLVLAEQPGALADYRAGKQKAFGFLMGQVMRKLGGAGNPALAERALRQALDGSD
ncbi:MAG: Asp-tRNA(Asn)/Glu-tRNA(Gln) amidotransferase subunit GatB [Oscillospiraceae bacterium]|jgi:aspartyl-tRNA(Asn)/glutamyl-tRNA(Gln) amidotransferase subunit B|nr:Asp-tRNA(Asn)/Glu-tRNA(Gln) amidotransferase subunit GatB [Oscillospiraceae bacterium]